MTRVTEILERKGLRRVDSPEVFYNSHSYLVDAREADSNGCFAVYPWKDRGRIQLQFHKERAEPVGDAYGMKIHSVHWKYSIDNKHWKQIAKEDRDVEQILRAIRNGQTPHEDAYIVSAQEIEKGGFWIFAPETLGWKYYKGILVPRFKSDRREYEDTKERLGGKRETKTQPVEPVAGGLTE